MYMYHCKIQFYDKFEIRSHRFLTNQFLRQKHNVTNNVGLPVALQKSNGAILKYGILFSLSIKQIKKYDFVIW